MACCDAAVVRQVAQLAGRELPPETRLHEPAVRPLLLALQSEQQAQGHRADVSPQGAASSYAQAIDHFLALAGSPQLERDEPYLAIRKAHQRRFGQHLLGR